MAHDPERTRGPYLLIGVVSFSCLVFELSLLRVFSITLWHHFAFMVISIAMLGIGASGTALAVFPGLRDLRRIPLYALLFALSLPASYLAANVVPFDPARLSWDRLQLVFIALYYLVLSVPFLLFGMIIAASFSGLSANSGAVYAADLLGAGTGSIAVLLFLSLGGPENAVFGVSCLAAASVVPAGRRSLRAAAAAVIVLDIVVLAVQPAVMRPRMSPYKPLEIALSVPGAEHLRTYHRPYARVDVFRSPAVRFAPGLSLTYLEPLPRQTGIAVDGGAIEAATDPRDPDSLAFLDHLPAALPYRLVRPDEVLVVDPRGGLEVLTAARMGARTVDAVESNLLLQRVARDLDERSGPREPGVRYASGMGRMWLASSKRSFDIIALSLAGALPSTAFGIAEDHRFTVEAFTTYLRHLKPGGILSVTQYILPPPRAELRILATLVEAAGRIGIGDAALRCIAIRSWDTMTVLFSRTPVTARQTAAALQFCRENRFDLVHYPGIVPDGTGVYIRRSDDAYPGAFSAILAPDRREAFLGSSLFDVRPVHDENPFAHYYLKLQNIRGIYRTMGERVEFFFEEGYLLPVLLLQVLLFGMLLLIAPLFALRRSRTVAPQQLPRGWQAYFAALGLGYLFVEVAFLQQTVLVLEHPSTAASTVIAALLIGSGTGSFMSRRTRWLRKAPALLMLAAVVAAYALALLPLLSLLGPGPLPLRVFTVFASLLPAGFLMGVPLPLGIMHLGASSPDHVPWAWAINGCFSVSAPILAVMIALSAGFTVVALAGAAMYVVAFLLLRRWEQAALTAGGPGS
jgi:hypothetical protein